MKKVIVYNRLEKPVLERLKKNYDVHFFKDIDPKTDEDFHHHLQDTDGIMGLELNVDKKLLDHAPNLKIVSNVSVGYNNLDVEELTKRGILATNTPDVLNDTVADTIFGILMAAARRIPELDQYVKSGNWQTAVAGPEYYGTDVHHKKLGIIGMGRIGQAIAKRAHLGFDMDILYHTRTRKQEAEEKYNAAYCSLEDLLKQSDFVCLMTPLTSETEGMIGEKELINALKNGKIAGAALDVFDQEPIQSDNPLLTMKNVVTTPHVGSSTAETELAMSELAAKNLETGLNGDRPPNLIDPSVWDKAKQSF